MNPKSRPHSGKDMAAEPPIAIQPFTETDLPGLTRLISSTIRRSYTGVYPPKAVAYFLEYHTAANILRDAAAGIVLVGRVANMAVATGTLVGSYLCRVFVRSDYQRRGYGQMVADELESLAIKRSVETLELDASLTSRQFWERRGWRVTAREVEMVEDQPLEYFKMEKVLGEGN